MTAGFRLMTANLLHERCDVADFARVLDRVAPDVVVTQELAPTCADVITSVFPNHRLRPSYGFLGRGIATRFDAEFGEIDMPGRPGTSVLLDVEGTTMLLGGVHLLNPIHFPWWITARARGRQLEGLFAWLDRGQGEPVVVAGDFNASPRWPAYKLTAQRLTDLVAERADRAGLEAERTWSWRPGWPRMLRIDHVFGEGARATDVTTEPILGTDHAAVVVDIELTAS
jgi:endonuclease/exonuclease/phosphatase family metal-dependent hydrolase